MRKQSGEPEDRKYGLTAAQLKRTLRYDKRTGVFTYCKPTSKGWPHAIGTIAGTLTKLGYIRIYVNRRAYMAHRLAWLYEKDAWPSTFLDHKNGVRNDNRISNLREASKAENAQNRSGSNKNSSHGWLGVSYRPLQGWASQIGLKNGTYNLGFFF